MAVIKKRMSARRSKSKHKDRKLATITRDESQDIAAISERSLKAIWDNPIDDRIWSNYLQTHQLQ